MDVYDAVEEFWRSGSLPRGCTITFIVLIPKYDHPTWFVEYRAINMVGSLYKIIANILAKQLQGVMQSLIGVQQSAFIRGRQILDGALIAGEFINSWQKRKSRATILKLDVHKAFDNISWSFLEWIMVQMNFPPQWRLWISSCVMSTSASILINGSPHYSIQVTTWSKTRWPYITLSLWSCCWVTKPPNHKIH